MKTALGPVSRRRIWLLVFLSTIAVSAFLVRWVAMDHSQILQSDFIPIDTAGTLWRDGQGNHLYDDAVQGPVYSALVAGDHSGDLLYEQAPLTAVMAAPVSQLNVFTAYRLWSLAQFLFLVAALVIAVRAAPWPKGVPVAARVAAGVAALAGIGTLTMALEGQTLGLHALGLAAFYSLWRSEKRGWAGVVIGFSACLSKPHLFVGVALWLLGRSDRRALWGAAAGVVTAAVLSLLLVGPGGMEGFASGLINSNSLWPLKLLYGFTGLFTNWFGKGWAGQGIALVFELITYAIAFWLGRRARCGSLEISLALALVASLLASPHLYSHDLALLAPAFVWVFAWAMGRDLEAGSKSWPGANSARLIAFWLVLNVAVTVDYGAQGVPVIFGRLTPIVLAGAVFGGWNALRTRTSLQ